jgi:AhpD family alkylhydroperoxidase
MMLNWNEHRDQVNGAIREISKANPDIVKAYVGLNAANAKSTRLDTKTRELITLAVAITLRCDGCINAHTDAAIKAGATKEEIVDALGVAVMVNGGAAMVYSARTIDAFDAKTGN